MLRRPNLLDLSLAWLPVGLLYAVLVQSTTGVAWSEAATVGLRGMLAAAVLGILVWRGARRLEWPHRMSAGFVAAHVGLALAFAGGWVALTEILESAVRLENPFWPWWRAPHLGPRMATGMWLYGTVAGVSYARLSSARLADERGRAARAEAAAMSARLAALRGQLNPHFLFNALNSIASLIPTQPVRAEAMVERLSELLRVAIDEARAEIPLADEWSFCASYLELEGVRFEERLRVSAEIPDECLGFLVPPFSLQCLVENAVKHGVAPRVGGASIQVRCSLVNDLLRLSVHDDGPGREPASSAAVMGSGLARLRNQLTATYGERAALACSELPEGGHQATLWLPAREVGSVPGSGARVA